MQKKRKKGRKPLISNYLLCKSTSPLHDEVSRYCYPATISTFGILLQNFLLAFEEFSVCATEDHWACRPVPRFVWGLIQHSLWYKDVFPPSGQYHEEQPVCFRSLFGQEWASIGAAPISIIAHLFFQFNADLHSYVFLLAATRAIRPCRRSVQHFIVVIVSSSTELAHTSCWNCPIDSSSEWNAHCLSHFLKCSFLLNA